MHPDNAIWFFSFAENEKEKQLLDKMSVEKSFSCPKKLVDISDAELNSIGACLCLEATHRWVILGVTQTLEGS
jgi:hypothetical protein